MLEVISVKGRLNQEGAMGGMLKREMVISSGMVSEITPYEARHLQQTLEKKRKM